MEKRNDEDDTHKSNNSKTLAPSSPSGKQKRKTTGINELPWDMLDVISKKLEFDDLFQFSGVCKSWRTFHKIFWKNFMASKAPLVIQTSFVTRIYSLFSISDERVYESVLLHCFTRDFYYSGTSSGYVTMVSFSDNNLMLMNPFTRRKKEIYVQALQRHFFCLAFDVLLAFVKGSKEFVIMAHDKFFRNLHIYHSRNSSWATCLLEGEARKIVDIVVFNNTIYAITKNAKIGVLSLNSSCFKFLTLKDTPMITNFHLRLVSCDGQLLVVNFVPSEKLNVYKIDFTTMSYVKMDTLRDLALFFGLIKCYGLSNPGRWGYESNSLYHVDGTNRGCKVYSGDDIKKQPKCILPPATDFKSSTLMLDWCFRPEHDEVDYFMVD